MDVIGNPTYNTNVTLGANLTNDGTLELDAETAPGSGNAILTGQTFTVTNAGTFETEGGTVSPDYLRTNITDTSTGTTKIDGITTDDGSGGATTVTNSGILSVGDGDAITITNGSGVTQTSTGTFEPTVDAPANKAYGIVGGRGIAGRHPRPHHGRLASGEFDLQRDQRRFAGSRHVLLSRRCVHGFVLDGNGHREGDLRRLQRTECECRFRRAP